MMLTRASKRALHRRASHQYVSELLPPQTSIALSRRRLHVQCRTQARSHLLGNTHLRRHASAHVAQIRSISISTDVLTYRSSGSMPMISTSANSVKPGTIDLSTYMPLRNDTLGTELNKRSDILGHNMNESMQNLRACLSVGRFSRAEAILRRLAGAYVFSAHELQEANNTFLRYYMHALFRGTDGVSLSKIQSWFEVDMRQLGLEPDSTTLALLTRTAFLLANTKARERTIRRYLHIAEEKNILETTMASGEYVPHEFNELCRIQAKLFKTLPQEVEVDNASSEGHSPSKTSSPEVVELRSNASETSGVGALLQGMQSFYIGQDSSTMSDAARAQWQIALEQDIVEAELERWRLQHARMLEAGINPAMKRRSMEAMLWEWQQDLHAAVRQHIKELQKNNESYIGGDGPYLEAVGSEKLAAITILESIRCMNKSRTGEYPKIYSIVNSIGSSLELEAAAKAFSQAKDSKKRQLKQLSRQSMLQLLRKFSKASEPPGNVTEPGCLSNTREHRSIDWPRVVKLRIAAFLLSKLVSVARISVCHRENSESESTSYNYTQEAAFSHRKVFENGKSHGAIKPHPEFIRRLGREPPPSYLAHQLPMVAKPIPWYDARGGYLRYPAHLMRLTDQSGIQDMYLHAAIQEGAMEEVFKGLNVLGSTPWKLNRRLFDVMAEIWNSGKAITNFPPAEPDLILPIKPQTTDVKQLRKWRTEVKWLKNQHTGFNSNRCAINAQMEIARAFLGHELFLPHNMDFRGRAYPVGGVFHHMGADNVRGLFLFSDGKPLGENGLFWLRVHLANKFGYDKATLQDREQFVADNWANIKDSADKPLDGKQWWLSAEDPWQCLAACFEVVAATEMPNPADYISHLPIHQDGTCNGLQHYAALGGDSAGASQVNLLPRDRPGDIYSEVARLVKLDVERDAQQGVPMAKEVEGLISRKVVKQPVMTYAYGVTFHGAKNQILKRLDEIIPDSSKRERTNNELATYIATKVFKHFGAMFTGATKIQHWLASSAGRISLAVSPQQIEHLRKLDGKKNGKFSKPKFQAAVVWTTPLNMPVVQPYRQTESSKSVATALQYMKVMYPNSGDEVLKRKQMAGFPPNFIHSLDASHMLLSAAKCNEQGITFASVHDSFWTHACDVPRLNTCLRDAFVHLHSEDIIGRLAEEFRTRYKLFLCQRSVPLNSAFGRYLTDERKKAAKLKKLKASSEPDVQSTRSATDEVGGKRIHYAYCTPTIEELLEEHDRLCLTHSDDPADRLKAESMKTPAVLFQALGADHPDLVPRHNAAVVRRRKANKISTPLDAESDDPVLQEEINAALVLQDPVFIANSELSSPTEPSTTRTTTSSSTTTTTGAGAGTEKTAEKKKPVVIRKVHFWAPLDFPVVPARGDFDINRVKESTYFFS